MKMRYSIKTWYI